MNKYLISGIAAGLLALFATAGTWLYQQGKAIANADCTAQQSSAVRHAIEQANALAEQDAEILRASTAKRLAQHQIDQRWKQEATRHVATHRDLYGQRLDACGLCLKHAAASGTDPATCPCVSNAAATTDSGQR